MKRFTKAMVKVPCRNMVNGISEGHFGPPNFELAVKQHKTYVHALQEAGLEVITLDADEDYPDSTFIEDTCLITPKCTIITNPGAPSRKGEVAKVSNAVEELGHNIERIQDPGTLDAGDVMMVQDHYYVGLSDRTNEQGAHQLDSILKRYGLSSSTIKLDGVLHLKTGVSYLENNNLLATEQFSKINELHKFNILHVVESESYAANSVWINDTVIIPLGFSNTRSLIRGAGYSVVEVDVSEFRKLDGGLSCLSLRF